MTKTSIGMLLVAGVMLGAACGGGETSSTSAGGAPATTSATTGEGGAASTSTGVGGHAATSTTSATSTTTSGGTGGAASDFGGPCKADADCSGMKCFDETNAGWPGGFCTTECDLNTPTCLGTGACVDDGSGTGVCIQVCTTGGKQCGDAYACVDVLGDGSVMGCLPACTSDAQCPTVGTCDTKQGFCIAPETDCTNAQDDDSDGFIDCEDATSCQGTAACKPGANDTGHACGAATDCKATGGDPFCFDEATQGWPKGYCSEYCDLTTNDCTTANAICVDAKLNSGNGLCVLGCTTAADCPSAGYACNDLGGGVKACLPGCTLDSQCAMFCNSDDGHCSQMDENCSNGMDDDGDGFLDCEDLDCATTCAAQVTMACLAPPVAVASNMSDTTGATNIFAASCTGSGSHEKIYSITPGVVGDFGVLSLNLKSATDQGIYVRTACGDATAEIGCVDANQGGTDENLDVEVKGGVPLTIFVDGFQPGGEGPFTLTTSYTSITPLCAAATAGKLGANAGDTTGGSTKFKGSCTGDGTEEKIFTFTPATTGTMHLVLNSATDQGIYVRSTCTDSSTELGCTDANAGGMDEVLDVAVTAGAPVTIFVDGFQAGEAGPFTLTLSVM